MSSTDTVAFALVIVGSISLLFFLSQVAVKEMNPSGTDFFDCSKSLLANAMTSADCGANGNYSLIDVNDRLPTTEAGVSPSTGNVFIDTYYAAKTWLVEKLGLGYVFALLSAPKNFLIALGLPTAVSFGLAAVWYMVLFFLFMSWLLGR